MAPYRVLIVAHCTGENIKQRDLEILINITDKIVMCCVGDSTEDKDVHCMWESIFE